MVRDVVMTLPPSDPSPDRAAPPVELPADEWDEDLYRATATVLIEPDIASSPWRGLGCLLLTLALFAASFFFWSTDLRVLGLIILILLLHETGHFAGMRVFGYRNVQMFFIPFFGAAVSGRKHAAPVWQQGVVLLLGPLPGILLGLALQAWYRLPSNTLAGEMVMLLVIVNGFNLLPVVPLDGGRLIDVLIFARRPWLAVAFRLLAVGALLLGAWKLASWVLAGIGVLMLLSTPARHRKARLERAFRDNPLELPPRMEELSDAQRRELFGWAMLLHPMDRTPTSLAADMRTLHENMVSRPPSLPVGVALTLVYLGGFAAGIAALALSRQHTLEAQTQALVQHARGTIERIAELGRQQRQRPAPDRRIQDEIVRHRQELLARWRRASADVQNAARTRLFTDPPTGSADHASALLLFLRDLSNTPADDPNK
jgi:Zn-dependent protease